MDNREESFRYTYSAKEQAEVESIRKKYLPKEEENKMEHLRRLDRVPHRKAQALSLTLGILGALILGTGMSLAMTDLGAALGSLAMVLGIPIGILGIVMVVLAYPAYNKTLKKEQEKIAPEILRLTEELMK